MPETSPGGTAALDAVALDRAAARVERATGRPLPDVVVDRRAASTASLRPLGALAAAAGQTVVLPLTAGPLTGARAAGLLVHELTHVAQQAADRHHAADAEDEARTAEARAGGRPTTPTSPPATAGEGPPVQAGAQAPPSLAVRPGGHLVSRAARGPARGGPSPVMPGTRPAGAGGTRPHLGLPGASSVVSAPRAAAPALPVALTNPVPSAPGNAGAPVQLATPDPLARTTSVLRESAKPDPLASLSEADLDELAHLLYGRLRSELRGELLADRDRMSDLTSWS